MAGDLEAKLEQARGFIKGGEPERARSVLTRLMQRHANHPGVNQLMCLVCVTTMQYERAHYHAERAVLANPSSPELLTNLGNCCVFIGKVGEAIGHFRRALELRPSHVGALRGLAQSLIDSGRLTEGIERFRALCAETPDDPRPLGNLATALLDAGHAGEAQALLERAAAMDPWNPQLLSNLASTLNYSEHADPAAVLEAHRRYGEALDRRPGAPPPLRHPGGDDPERALRIGVLSADLRNHSVSFYARALLRWLPAATPGAFTLVAYYNEFTEDAVSQELKRHFESWRSVRPLRDIELAEQIRRDRIDILIELSGHTIGERYGALRLKPAPVIATCIGYPNTSGVRAVDYRIVDSIADPPGTADALATERLVRIDPCFLCYTPFDGAPEPSPAPCLASGRVTFGSFNNIAKLTDATVRLWSRLVNEVEGSTLLLKAHALRDEGVRGDVLARFERAGLDAARLTLLPPNDSRAEHLAMYGRIDLGLDPYPYHGTTTTCEAFHMGLPVVSLAGRVHAARVGASLLSAIGLPELAAEDEGSFIATAAGLARDPARLSALRAGMRERLLSSVLCDGPAYGARLGGALREMWRRYCAGGSG